MRTRADRNGTIEDAVINWLSAKIVDSVQVARGVDSDGDAVINITVVLKPNEKPDRRKMIGLARHLREKITEPAFPLIEFISLSDAKRKSAAA